jgi:hypothetical protein
MRLLLIVMTMALCAEQATAAEPTAAERAVAIKLFDEGRALMAEDQFDRACPKLEEARRLAPGLGIIFNLALCHERIGKTASAWVGYREAAALAAGKEPAREQDARDHAAALEKRLTSLVIEVTTPLEGLVIRRGAAVVERPQWSVAVSVDPGRYLIAASAPGKREWQHEVQVEGEGKTVRVVVPALAATADPSARAPFAPTPPAAATQIARPAGDRPAPASLSPRASATRPWQRPLGIATFALGGATLLAAGGVAIAAKSRAASADCDAADVCSDAGVADRNAALTQGNVATGLIVAGSVLGAAGLAIWLSAPGSLGGRGPNPAPAHPATRGQTLVIGVGAIALRSWW